MATLKDKFSKGLTTINVKTNTFMEQNKISTHISTLEREISNLKMQLGELVYTKWVQDDFELSLVEEILNTINAKYQEIEIQRNKMEQVSLEEQKILGTVPTSSWGQHVAEEEKEETIFCTNCGSPSSANHKFCTKCGSPL